MLPLNDRSKIYGEILTTVQENASCLKHIEFEDGTRCRFFISTGGFLCRYGFKKRRRGPLFKEHDVTAPIRRIVLKDDIDTKAWKGLDKVRLYAEMASFTNPFINNCLSIPMTQDDWVLLGKRSACQYRVNSDNSKVGEMISVESVDRIFYGLADKIQSQESKTWGARTFRGYCATVQLKKSGDEFYGWLNLNSNDSAHGPRYLLINDGSFVYYGID